MSTAPVLSIIVPCYNERENLERGVIEEMARYLACFDRTYEVIISDDGSSDNSRKLVLERIATLPQFRLLQNPHGGKPSAVWNGIQAATGDIVLFTDLDQSTPLREVDKLLPSFDRGYDVVIGSRGIERENFDILRRLGSAVFRWFRRLLVLPGISDTQCGFKAMRLKIALELFPQLEAIRAPESVVGWRVTAFDVELLFLARRAGYHIDEVVVEWANRDVATGKDKSYLAESREMAGQVLRVRLNAWLGRYGKAGQSPTSSQD